MVYPRAGVSTFFREDGSSTLNDPAVIAACEKYVALFGKQTARSDLTADSRPWWPSSATAARPC